MLTSNAARASFDWRAFARDCRAALERRDMGYRALAAEIGVTISDLSRAAGGSNISVEKVIALCDFMRVDPRAYYRAPLAHEEKRAKTSCFTEPHVKPRRARA